MTSSAQVSTANRRSVGMATFVELVTVILALTVLLSLVLPIVLIIQKVRGASTKEALRFAGAGFGICFAVSTTFVLGVSALSLIVDPDDTLKTELDCERLGGELQYFPDAEGNLGSICVVG